MREPGSEAVARTPKPLLGRALVAECERANAFRGDEFGDAAGETPGEAPGEALGDGAVSHGALGSSSESDILQLHDERQSAGVSVWRSSCCCCRSVHTGVALLVDHWQRYGFSQDSGTRGLHVTDASAQLRIDSHTKCQAAHLFALFVIARQLLLLFWKLILMHLQRTNDLVYLAQLQTSMPAVVVGWVVRINSKHLTTCEWLASTSSTYVTIWPFAWCALLEALTQHRLADSKLLGSLFLWIV
jgi:hypothetical protein